MNKSYETGQPSLVDEIDTHSAKLANLLAKNPLGAALINEAVSLFPINPQQILDHASLHALVNQHFSNLFKQSLESKQPLKLTATHEQLHTLVSQLPLAGNHRDALNLLVEYAGSASKPLQVSQSILSELSDHWPKEMTTTFGHLLAQEGQTSQQIFKALFNEWKQLNPAAQKQFSDQILTGRKLSDAIKTWIKESKTSLDPGRQMAADTLQRLGSQIVNFFNLQEKAPSSSTKGKAVSSEAATIDTAIEAAIAEAQHTIANEATATRSEEPRLDDFFKQMPPNGSDALRTQKIRNYLKLGIPPIECYYLLVEADRWIAADAAKMMEGLTPRNAVQQNFIRRLLPQAIKLSLDNLQRESWSYVLNQNMTITTNAALQTSAADSDSFRLFQINELAKRAALNADNASDWAVNITRVRTQEMIRQTSLPAVKKQVSLLLEAAAQTRWLSGSLSYIDYMKTLQGIPVIGNHMALMWGGAIDYFAQSIEENQAYTPLLVDEETAKRVIAPKVEHFLSSTPSLRQDIIDNSSDILKALNKLQISCIKRDLGVARNSTGNSIASALCESMIDTIKKAIGKS